METILSYVPPPIDAYVEKAWGFFARTVRTMITVGVRMATGKGELERICGTGWHSDHMTKRFLRSLRLAGHHTPSTATASTSWSSSPSSALSHLFQPSIFNVPTALDHLLAHHLHPHHQHHARSSSTSSTSYTSISQNDPDQQTHQQQDDMLLRENLSQCLEAINYVNAVCVAALKLKDTKFGDGNREHEALLEQLWSALKPNITRKGGRITEEWSEIGFQGKDPATDFRGMGLLGLHQLVYFAKNRPQQARSILLESNHPRRYYPFAATGINISSFVLSLLVEERLLDEVLVEECEKDFEHQPHSKAHHEDPILIQKGLDLLHNLYGDIYIDFNQRWVVADPPNIMAFPTIIEQLKGEHRREWKRKRGDDDLMTALLGQ